MTNSNNHSRSPIANSTVVFREEFDDWALLFDPDTNDIFAMDPVAAFIWKRLDGRHTPKEILDELRVNCEGMADDALVHIENFVRDLARRGLAGYELKKGN